MRCPADGGTLVRTALVPGAVVFACAACTGRAVALPVLRRHLGEGAVRELWRRTGLGASVPVDGVACPSCWRPMGTGTVPTDDDRVEVDVCAACALVWFDPGEHDELPPMPPPPAPAVVDDGMTTEQRQRFAILRVREMAREAASAVARDAPDHLGQALPALLGLPVELAGARLRQQPWATWLLALVVALVSMVGFTDETFFRSLALVPREAVGAFGLTTLTAFFLHGDWLHLLGNLWFLVVFGDDVEDRLGRRRWAALLVAATFAGGVAHCLADPGDWRPCVGASGGISGLIVCYALLLPHARIGFFVRYRWFTCPAWIGLVLWLLVQLFVAWLQVRGFGNVSALAHLGGAAVGLGAWWLWRERAVRA